MAVSCMRNVSGNNYRKSLFIVGSLSVHSLSLVSASVHFLLVMLPQACHVIMPLCCTYCWSRHP